MRSAFSGIALSPVASKKLALNRRDARIVAMAQSNAAGDAAETSIPDKLMEATGGKAKIATYFGTWWTLNVIFNIYNKKVLNAFPYPWLTSTMALAAGVAIMALAWGTGIVEKPDTDLDFWKGLAPVSFTIRKRRGSLAP